MVFFFDSFRRLVNAILFEFQVGFVFFSNAGLSVFFVVLLLIFLSAYWSFLSACFIQIACIFVHDILNKNLL